MTTNDSMRRPARPSNEDGPRRRRRRRRPAGEASPQSTATPGNATGRPAGNKPANKAASQPAAKPQGSASASDDAPRRRRRRRSGPKPEGAGTRTARETSERAPKPGRSKAAPPVAAPTTATSFTKAAGPGVETFAELGLSEAILAAVAATGYVRPTPIQSHAIPPSLAGRDVLGAAQTGTGKTAAFALPTIQRLSANAPKVERGKRGPIRALILAPTRELAAQIGENFETYAAKGSLRTLVIFGGVSKVPQERALRGTVDVLVATPGRLMDLMGDRVIDLSHVETFILDEADRMLDMGFIRDVNRIADKIPEHRQTLMFSATMPEEIDRLASRLLRDPVRVAVDPISSARKPISQQVVFVEQSEKAGVLLDLLRDDPMERVLVFTRTKHGANRLVKKLVAAGHGAAAIHGNKSQGARTRALEGFRSGELRVVVATDIAARGIDIDDLSHVVNYELPNIPESYVHRIGRTGRAGRSGVAISFCAPDERAYMRAIEQLTKQKLTELRVD